MIDILDELKKINEKIERIEKNTQRMDNHITFVNTVYNALWIPLEYIRNKFTVGKPLPALVDLSQESPV
jgi:hypothetical protein